MAASLGSNSQHSAILKENMSQTYKITITKITTEQKEVTQWKELYSDEVFMRLREEKREMGEDPHDLKQNAYVSKNEEVEKSEIMLEQIVENFNLPEVIIAINGLR